jgi:predicted ATPase/DNA-binding XRE family transcriptional regulator
MASEFGALLRRFRQDVGLSQEALAEAAAVSTSAIGAYERGVHSAPHRDTVKMLAQALGLSDEARVEFERVARRKPRATLSAAPSAVAADTLPIETSSFVGRDDEIAALEDVVRRNRAITVTGIGGIGKTRLALRVARRMSKAFADGVVFVDLGAISEPALVGPKAASALDIVSADTAPSGESIAAQLRNRAILVVLDNCEHVLDAAADLVSALVHGAQNVSILATSRERLRITGEAVYRLAPLSPQSALALFAERASSVERDFTLTAERAGLVDDICRKLDGIPLALELAASRVGTLGLPTLQAQLTEQLAILSGGNRDVPSRQRTLDATLAWSFELLEERERIAFRRLGTFAGDWTLDAALDVCSDELLAREDVFESLSSLVEKSLVSFNGDADPPRYRLLRLPQMYAVAKARESGEFAKIAKRHAGWMASRARRAHLEIDMPRPAWHRRYDSDLDNMRTAIEWALGAEGEPLLAAEIITGFVQVWSDNGMLAEHRQWTRRALDHIDAADHPRVVALLLRMVVKSGIGQERVAAGERAIELLRALNDPIALAHALGAQASLLQKSAQGERALYLADEAARLYSENGLDRSVAFAYVISVRASLSTQRGDHADARAQLHRALALAEEHRDDAFVSYGRTLLAGFVFLAGDAAAAVGIADEALRTARDMGFRHDEMLLLCNRACYSLAQNKIDDALADAVGALTLARENDPLLVSIALQHIATACALRRMPLPAARLLGFVDAFNVRMGVTPQPSDLTSYETLRIELRALLDDSTITRLGLEGARLDVSDAVREALEIAQPVCGSG